MTAGSERINRLVPHGSWWTIDLQEILFYDKICARGGLRG